MRTHIAKSLQARCKAIKNAVKIYNKSALALDPPRPTIDWSAASHYKFLEDFAFLQGAQDELRSKPWSEPLGREILKKARRIDRAREEIERCNVEVRRLYTSILDEHDLFSTAQQQLREQESPLCGVLDEFCDRRRRINLRHLQRLELISQLDGFTGSLVRGTREGIVIPSDSDSLITASVVSSVPANVPDGLGVVMDDEELISEQDDDLETEVGGVVDYISNLV